MAPKIDFWKAFWDVFLAPSFWSFFGLIFHGFLMLETLKIVVFPQENCYFFKICIFSKRWQEAPKCMQKSMDFEVENREKSMKKSFRKTSSFSYRFFMNSSLILASFWRILGRFWAQFWCPKRVPKGQN